MLVSYRTDQPELGRISHTLDAIAQQTGSEVVEHSRDRGERQTLARDRETEQVDRGAELTR